MKSLWQWLLLIAAIAQFLLTALPPGNDDLISIQSLALDFHNDDTGLLYPGEKFRDNPNWVRHHTENLRNLGANAEPNWCFYPPLVPWIVSPLATLGAESWRLIWGGVQLLLIFGFVLLLRRLLLFEFDANAPLVLLFALVLGCYPVARNIELGQTSLLLALIFWGGVYLKQRRPSAAAVLAGATVFVKPFLFAPEIGRLANREFKRPVLIAIFVGAVFGISVLLLGWDVHRDYFAFLFTLSDSQTGYWGNQSFYGAALRLIGELPGSYYGFNLDEGLSIIGKVVTLAFIIAAAVVQRKSRQYHPVFSTGLWLSAIFLGLSIAWEHHFIFLIPVIAGLWIVLRGRLQLTLLSAATLFLSLNLTSFYGNSLGASFVTVPPAAGNLILFILLSQYLVTTSSRV